MAAGWAVPQPSLPRALPKAARSRGIRKSLSPGWMPSWEFRMGLCLQIKPWAPVSWVQLLAPQHLLQK